MDNNQLNNQINSEDSAFASVDDLYGKKVKTVPKPEKNIGIDLSSQILKNSAEAISSSKLDLATLESFTRVSQDRETIYDMLDMMAEDSTIASVIEIYAEDTTETNEQGQIVWSESDDAEVNKFVTYLLDSINIDKHIYQWAYNLIRYGDLYLRLYHESDIEDGLFNAQKSKEQLNEDIVIKAYKKKDKLVHYVEMVSNPAEIFELTKFGKSYAYIEAPLQNNQYKANQQSVFNSYRYQFRKKDISIYEPTEFVHAALEDNSSRIPEEVDIFRDDDYSGKLSYKVRRGQSLLYNSFKIWREMMLLENCMLLNRLTKSSLVRVVNVEVGDMPKEQVGPHLMGIKQLMEQKSAINEGNSLREYTNPGPIENNIYVPTRNGQGSISTQQIGGDVDVKGLADVDFFKNKLYSSLGIPKMFLGDTDDAAGFNGGTSLSIISSRYAKTIKRIQNTLIQAITDIINIMLIDKGLDSYVNRFTIRMQEPTTQEEIDRRNNLSTKVQAASDIMNLASDLDDPESRLKLLKTLISPIIQDSDIVQIIQDKIDALEEQSPEADSSEDTGNSDFSDLDDIDFSAPGPGIVGSGNKLSDIDVDNNTGTDTGTDNSESPSGESGDELPSPSDLGAGDFTNNNLET